MRLYLDTNVYAHVQDLGVEDAMRGWLVANRHRAVLSDVLLGEAIAIKDHSIRDRRLRLLASLPSRRTRNLGELQAMEFVNEVRRRRPDWRRLPIGDMSFVNELRAAHKEGWQFLNRNANKLIARASAYRIVEERAIHGSRAGQQALRKGLLDGDAITSELVLGTDRVPVRQLNLNDADDFCRMESLFAWYGAMIQELPTLSDYRNYAWPYVNPTQMSPSALAEFWLNEIDLSRIPRGWATSLAIFAQLRTKIGHGNAADIRHAGHIVDADIVITEDRGFYEALQLVAEHVPGAAQPRFIKRNDPQLIDSMSSAVDS